jgi:hypothetical protein
MSSCQSCGDQGAYMSRRCREEICAHLGVKNDKGVFDNIVMECPERICICRFGQAEKRRRKKLAEAPAPPPPLPVLEDLPLLPPATPSSL